METDLIRLPEVRRMVGEVSESTVYKWTHRRGFPKPGRLGGRVSVWHRADVQRWIAMQMKEAA